MSKIKEYSRNIVFVYSSYLKRISLVDVLKNYIIIFLSIVGASFLLPRLNIESLTGLAIFSIVFLLVTVFIIPILNYIFLKITVKSFGLFSLLLNALILATLMHLDFGVTFEGGIIRFIFADIVFVFVISLISSVLISKPIDNFELMFLKSVAENPENTKNTKGLYFLEIDGLSEEVLEYAMENGYADTMKRWRDNSHTLIGWECDLSSQTSASQAGILHGDNLMIPAFRWFDREKQRVVTSNNFKDAKFIQSSISDGKGILANEGISFNNMFHGDSPDSSLNISGLGSYDERREALMLYFLYPQSLQRSIVFIIQDLLIEIKDAMLQQIRNVQPRVHRGIEYIPLRPFMTVLTRDLAIFRVMEAMMSGKPAIYTTFGGYDEVAHHAGIYDKSALNVLRRLDDQFEKLDYMRKYIKGDYKFVVLSDHGQSQGWTFKQRFGYSLDEFVQKEIGEDAHIASMKHHDEHHADWVQTKDRLLHRKQKDQEKSEEPGKVISMASGNQGLIFFTGYDHRLTLEEINKIDGEFVDKLASHPGIQFVFVDTKEFGPVIMNNYGKRYLNDDKVEGKDPLHVYESPHTLDHIKRYNTSPNVPDIMVMSMYDSETKEVAAFEELVGNHGGLGGQQSHPFILYPKSLDAPTKELVGARSVYETIKSWLKDQ